ncbi:unnamed protein product, partial [Staurois parvus]
CLCQGCVQCRDGRRSSECPASSDPCPLLSALPAVTPVLCPVSSDSCPLPSQE